MTEAEWLTCDSPQRILDSLNLRTTTARKLRLFACACARWVWPVMPNAECETAVESAERVADKKRAKRSLTVAYKAARRWSLDFAREHPNHPRQFQTIALADCCESSAYSAAQTTAMYAGMVIADGGTFADTPTSRALAELARCVFGNPFRPVAFTPTWRTDTAVALARQMYDSRDFGAMPILADALQDAGCENEDVLTHCRDANQIHARGCWVCDAVLGKA